MRIRNFSSTPRPRNAITLDLAPRHALVLQPDTGGSPVPVELDLALLLEKGQAALVVVTPQLLALGLTPAASVMVITPADPVAILRLWVNPPTTPVEIPAGTTIARLLLIEGELMSLVDDPHLDDVLDPEPPSPFAQFADQQGQAPFRGGGED